MLTVRNSAPDPELLDLIDAYEMGGDADEEEEDEDDDPLDEEGYL